jgi:LysR family glycine cleavage system transcriptional activator
MPIDPPFPRLPPLNALRAFEAAARLGGFAAAADELKVTPGAVAAHVKALEDELGAPLFERHSRRVRLTALGQRAFPAFVDAFDRLGVAAQDLRQAAAPGKVHIAALPAIAELWLSPRLPGLRDILPGVDISISAVETPPNLKRAPFDLCAFFTDMPPADARIVGDDSILPVCAPSLVAGLQTPDDLLSQVCLTDTAWEEDWTVWAKVAMPGRPFVPKGPRYSLYSLVVAQAVSGAGILMGHRMLVARHLREGSLVAPFDIEVSLGRVFALWRYGGASAATTSKIIRELAPGITARRATITGRSTT